MEYYSAIERNKVLIHIIIQISFKRHYTKKPDTRTNILFPFTWGTQNKQIQRKEILEGKGGKGELSFIRLARISSLVVVSRSDRNRHPCLFPNLNRTIFSLSPVSKTLADRFFNRCPLSCSNLFLFTKSFYREWINFCLMLFLHPLRCFNVEHNDWFSNWRQEKEIKYIKNAKEEEKLLQIKWLGIWKILWILPKNY